MKRQSDRRMRSLQRICSIRGIGMLPNKLKNTAPKAVFSRICSHIYTACQFPNYQI